MGETASLSYTCPCGAAHACRSVWAAAHWDETLRHTCQQCGRTNDIRSGVVLRSKVRKGNEKLAKKE